MENIFCLKIRNFVYSRGGNPTVNLLERRMAKLEEGVDAVCFSSGMGAIATTLLSVLKKGDTLMMSDIVYGSTLSLAQDILTKFGIKTITIDLVNLNQLERTLKNQKKVKAVFFETPCNPTLKIINISSVKKLADKFNSLIIVDNTLATPYFQKPLKHGADIVIHSLSKYLNGHGDVLGGVTIAKEQRFIDNLKFSYMCHLGTVMDANSAFLILRGLKTFEPRMKAHEENAKSISLFLKKHPRVTEVIYPGLSNFGYKSTHRKQMTGDGAIISFYLKKFPHKKVEEFLKRLSIFKLAVSFGGTESLIEYPLYMTHRHYLKDKTARPYKQLKNLIRLSVGLENVKDLVADLKKGLSYL
jgi:methionine-gamma-lyase